MHEKEVAHRRQWRRLDQVYAQGSHDKHAGANLGYHFQGPVTPRQENRHRQSGQAHRENRNPVLRWECQTEVYGKKVVQHRRRRHQAAGLADNALDDGRDQNVPERPFLPCRPIGVQHAASGRMGETDRHLKAVVLENVGYRDAPEQGVGKPPSGHRCRDQVAGSDAGHHQNDAGTEVPCQSTD